MDFGEFVEQIGVHADALRAAAVEAGPDAEVPTCPGWTVRSLVAHIGRVHARMRQVVEAAGAAEVPPRPTGPEDWPAALEWWDEQRAGLIADLRRVGPDHPARLFLSLPPVALSVARRQAHETAIHRLDAEHARAGSARPDALPSLLFNPELAADGIDELIVGLMSHHPRRAESTARGTVLVHAADAGRHWLVVLRPGEPLDVHRPDSSGVTADATLAGTADAVYRAVWQRPSTAVITGDVELVRAIGAP